MIVISEFVEIKETGTKECLQRLEYFRTHFSHEVAAALKQEAELTMTESKKQVPVDTGSLRDSGFVQEPIISGNNISIKMGYGGVATKVNSKTGEVTTTYAVIVHENMAAHHTVGNAKFLEKPIMNRSKDLLARINLRVKRMLEKGGII